jgi:hypothetical protein
MSRSIRHLATETRIVGCPLCVSDVWWGILWRGENGCKSERRLNKVGILAACLMRMVKADKAVAQQNDSCRAKFWTGFILLDRLL